MRLKKPERVPDLNFFWDFWVPYWARARAKYEDVDNRRYRRANGFINYKEALAAHNRSIGNIAQRSSVVTSSISILLASNVIIFINFNRFFSGNSKYFIIIGGILLLISLALVMSTMYLHWAEYIDCYRTEKSEFERKRFLSWSRAFRVNAAIFFATVGMLVSLGGGVGAWLATMASCS
jgi:hypothetical protein